MGVLLHILNPLGSMLFGSIVPKVFDFFKARQDNAHELAVLQLQIDAQKAGAQQKLEAIGAQGDADAFVAAIQAGAQKSGVAWVDAYNSIIRPGIATLVMGMYVAVKIVQMVHGESILSVWKEEDSLFLETIVGYFYGDRSHFKSKK